MYRRLVIMTFLCVAIGMMAAAQCDAPTSKDTSFWVAFLHNNGEAGTPALTITALSDIGATLTVENPRTAWSTSVTLATSAYSNINHAEVTVPWSEALNAQPSTATAFGLHVSATSPVWLTAANMRLASADAATIVPASQLGTRYIVQDYATTTSVESSSSAGAEIVILATTDGTVVTMTLPCATVPATVAPGNTLTINLDRGQTYLLVTPTPSQFTGMEVTANHPIALFQGNRIAALPNGNYTSGDHIFEQALPVSRWGTDFVAVATHGRTWGDLVRITAADDPALLVIGADTVATLAPRATYDYHLPGGSTAHIHTSAPASAMLVMASSTWNAQPGDVSSVMLTPMDAGTCDALVRLVHTERCNTYWLALATSADGVAGMTLDGTSIAAQFSGTGTWRHALIAVAEGNHHIACSGATFTGYAYAMGNVESYLYPLARSFPPFVYDTVHLYDTICQGQPYDNHSIHLAPNVTAEVGDTIIERDVAISSTYLHYFLHLTIHPVYSATLYDTIAFGDTLFVADTALVTAGIHTIPLVTRHGCDSTLIVVLTISTDTIHLYDTVCQGQPYARWGFVADDPQRSLVLHRDTVVLGAPLHYCLHLTVLPVTLTVVHRSLVVGDTLHFADTAVTTAGTWRFVYTGVSGCDSVVELVVDYEAINLVASRTGICPGDSVVLTASGTHAFRWHSVPPCPELDSLQGRNPIVVHPLVTTTFSLVDDDGNAVSSVTVSTDQVPLLCVDVNRRELDFDNPLLLFTDCSEGRHHTLWHFSDGLTFTGHKVHRQFSHPLPDSIIVTMSSCNRYDCCADTTMVVPMRIRSVWFPNVFTPDASDNNLFRCFTSVDVADFMLVVYNRWGFEMWSSSDVNLPWDGRRADGTPCPQGAYVYRYWITAADGNRYSGIGTVTILR